MLLFYPLQFSLQKKIEANFSRNFLFPKIQISKTAAKINISEFYPNICKKCSTNKYFVFFSSIKLALRQRQLLNAPQEKSIYGNYANISFYHYKINIPVVVQNLHKYLKEIL